MSILGKTEFIVSDCSFSLENQEHSDKLEVKPTQSRNEQEKENGVGWRDVSLVKSTYYPCRVLKHNSQYPLVGQLTSTCNSGSQGFDASGLCWQRRPHVRFPTHSHTAKNRNQYFLDKYTCVLLSYIFTHVYTHTCHLGI